MNQNFRNNIPPIPNNRVFPQPLSANVLQQNSRNYQESSPPEQIIDDVLPDNQLNSNPNRLPAPIQQRVTVSILPTATKQVPFRPPPPLTDIPAATNKQPIPYGQERQFRRASSSEMRAQVKDVKSKLKEFSLNDCREKVQWLATVCLQQQLDLDLLRSSAQSVEDWTAVQLKRLSKLEKNYSIMTNQKKKLEERDKQLKKEKLELSGKNLEMTLAKEALEKELKELKPYKTKYEELLRETKQLGAEKEKANKQIIQLREEKEKFSKFVNPKLLADVEAERDQMKLKLQEVRREETTMRQRISELEKKLIAEKMANRNKPLEQNNSISNDKEKSGSIGTADDDLGARKAKLEAKNAQIEKLREEIKTKDAELDSFKEQMDKAKHRVMDLREKLRRKKEEAESSKTQLGEEQVKRERAEQGVARLEKELETLRKKLAEQEGGTGREQNIPKRPTEPNANVQQIPTKKFDQRLREMQAKKEQLEKAILAVSNSKTCEKCRDREKELNEVKQKNEELTALVQSKDAEIDELKKARRVSIRMIDPNTQLSAQTDGQILSPPIVVQQQPQPGDKRPREEAPAEVEAAPSKRQRGDQALAVESQQRPVSAPAAQTAVKQEAAVIQIGGETSTSASESLSTETIAVCPPSTTPTAQQNNQHITVNSRASSLPVPSSMQQSPNPALVIQPPPPYQPPQEMVTAAAARIVTAFMMFLGQPQNINKNARLLIPEFLQQSALPPDHLIAEQLVAIAEEAQKAKQHNA